MSHRPTLERARTELHHLMAGRHLHLFGGTDLLASKDVEVHRLAALILRASVVLALVVEHEVEIAAEKRDSLSSLANEVVLQMSDVGKCSTCDLPGFQNGKIPCSICGGTGMITIVQRTHHSGAHHGSGGNQEARVQCRDCHGTLEVVCPTCGGYRMTVRARMQRTTYEQRAQRHVYLPSLSVKNDAALETIFEHCTPPATLRLAVSTVEETPDDGSLEGFDFENRLNTVKSVLDGMFAGGAIVQSECNVYGWPLLVLRAKGVEAVVYVDAAGVLRAEVDESV